MERQFNEKANATCLPFKVRAANSLKSRFQLLAAIEKPTVEGEMQQLIRWAKEINEDLHNMIDAGTLEDGEYLEESVENLAEALHEGPVPGGADSSETTQEQLNDVRHSG